MRKTIAFVTAGLPFNGNSLQEKSLGGSESAMIYMAKELASFGNVVYVYCDCDKPGEYDNVIYRPVQEFINNQQMRVDVLIMSRRVEFTPSMEMSNLTVFWMHDVLTEEFHQHAFKADKVFLMSNYQKGLWEKANCEYGQMINVTKNGFDIDLAQATKILPFDKRKNNYIFPSKPERGLKYVLSNLWPKILEINPDAKLHICTYENNLPMPEEGRKLHADLNKEINDLAYGLDGIIRQGFLQKRDFYKLLGQCAYMVYPCVFPEISCISAIEAQAMGILVIAPDQFALTETVKTPTLVTGEQGAEYDEQFMGYIEKYQDKKEFLELMGPVVNEVRNTYSWRRIAAEWDLYFDQMFKDRYEQYKPQVFKKLAHNSDFVTLSEVDSKFDTDLITRITKNNLTYEYFTMVRPEDVQNPLAYNGGERTISMWNRIDEHFACTKKKLTVMELASYDGMLIGHVFSKHKNRIKEVIVYEGHPDAIAANKRNWNPDGKEPFTYVNDDLLKLHTHKLKADVIIAGEILEHMKDWKKFLNDINNCANPGALVVFSTPVGPWSSVALKEKKQDFKYEHHLIHYEFLDLMTIFQEHIEENEFFIKFNNGGSWSYRGEALNHFTFGYVKNNVDAKFHNINFKEKAIKTRPYFSLSTIMIARNEEDYISKCLKSVRSISDEIIMVDTGSTDDTKRIVEKYTDKIYDYKWEEEDGLGDFSKARNYSLDKATGDWVFYIDADEELIHSEKLPFYINSPYFDTICIKQKQLLLEGGNEWDQDANRLFKNHGRHRFHGAIHEFPRLSRTEGFGPLTATIPDAALAHYGYISPDVNTKIKLQRNHQLLLKDIKQTPYRPDNFTYLVRDMWHFYQLESNGKYLDKAVEAFSKYPKVMTTRFVKYKWLECFKQIQKVRYELMNRYKYHYVPIQIEDKTLLVENIDEYEKYKSLLQELSTVEFNETVINN